MWENRAEKGEQNFYPRPPRGGRRFFLELLPWTRNISIHALREEGDMVNLWHPI